MTRERTDLASPVENMGARGARSKNADAFGIRYKGDFGRLLPLAFLAVLIASMFLAGMGSTLAWAEENINVSGTIEVHAQSCNVDVTDQNGNVFSIGLGDSMTFEGSAPETVRISSEGAQKPVSIDVVSDDGIKLEDPSLFEEGPWFRDITFIGMEKQVVVDMPNAGISLFSASSSAPSEERPEVGDVFTGKCMVTVVDQNGTGGSVNSVICSPSSGILTEFPGIRCYCADHSAAAPYVGQNFTYTYTITSVNKKTGEVKGVFYATAVTGSTDGVTTDSSGRLTGYQRTTINAIITRNYCGYMRIKKTSFIKSISASNSLYSLDGATYRIYEDKQCTVRSDYDDLVTEEGKYVKSEEIAAGTYYVKEIKAPKGFEVSTKVYKVDVEPEQTTDIGTETDGVTTVQDTPRHNPSKFVLAKLDGSSSQGWAQGDSSLQGAKYKVRYFDGQYTTVQAALDSGAPKKTWVFSSDANGKINMSNESYLDSGTLYKDDDGNVVFPLGTYIISETSPSEGYLLSDEVVRVRIMKDPDSNDTIFKGNVVKGTEVPESGTTYTSYANVVMLKEPPIKGSMEVEKRDMESGTVPQGDADFARTEFELSNISKNPIIYEGRKVPCGFPICTLAIGPDSNVSSLNLRCLPYGTYSLREIKAGNGYQVSEVQPKTFKISSDGQVQRFCNEESFKNEPKRGIAKVSKADRETKEQSPQGDATLEGTEFQITNKSLNPIFYKGERIDVDELVCILRTDENGNCSSEELAFGTYSIKETKASEGYLLTDSAEKQFKVTEHQQSVVLDFANDPIRGALELEKRDLETGELSPIGSATLEGTRFEVANLSKNKVLVSGHAYLPGEVCAEMCTGKDGKAHLADRALPYGTYSLTEVSPSRGYLLSDSEPRIFSIRADGEIAFYGRAQDDEPDNHDSASSEDATDEQEPTMENKTIKGDAFYNQVMREDLSFVKVRGETSERMPAIPFQIESKTTGESHILMTDENGEARTEASWNHHTTSTNNNDSASEGDYDLYAGVWWGTTLNGVHADPNDALRALPYDDYILREISTKSNEDYVLVEFEFSVKRDDQVIDLGTIENNPPELKQDPSISTSASDSADGDKQAYASSSCKLSDKVEYMNLKPGKNYTLNATVLDASTLQVLPGGSASLDFTPDAVFGSVTIEVECDTLGSAGQEVVFFEEVTLDGEIVCSHMDGDDASQKVSILRPEVVTYAKDPHDGDKTIECETGSYVVDEVLLKNLEANMEYDLYGIVMDARANVPAPINLAGENELSTDELEAFWSGLLNLLEADVSIEEGGYSCDIPYGTRIDLEKIGSYLESNKRVSDAIDIVSKSFVSSGDPAATLALSYPVESQSLEGDYVIFDLLLKGDTVVAVHADTANQDQSFLMAQPKISTTATDFTDSDHIILPSTEAKIVDLIEYSGLKSGEEYEITGTLMNKSDGKALYVNDKIVESTTTFTPNASSGKVEVAFSFDASSLKEGHSLVVFERLRKDGREIAEHTDINDAAQSVTVSLISVTDDIEPGSPIPSGGPYYKTGNLIGKGLTGSAIVIAAVAILSAMSICRSARRRPKHGNRH